MALQKINFTDQSTSLFQDNVDKALTPIQNAPLVGGNLLKSVSLTSGQDNLINHNLGSTPTMILPLVPNVSTTVWSPDTAALQGSNASPTQINLRVSTSCIISIWVN